MARLGTSDNQVDILIQTTADTKGIDKTSTSLTKLESSAGVGSKATAALGVAGVAAAAGIAAAGVAIGAAGAAAIGGAASYEQSRIAFETMLGSADKARSLMSDIADFAKQTPFELPEVVAGTKQLLAFGFAQKDLLPTMRKLGDLASGLGVPVGQLTNVFGQVKVAGRLMGQDLLQFTNAGVPLIEALATTMKKPQSEIKKLVEQGKVGFPEVEVAINSLTGEGSKFGGMMEKQSHTFNGVVSNIKDGFGQMLRGAVGMTVAGDIVQGGLFDRIKHGAEAVMPVVARLGTQAGPAMSKAMDKIGDAVSWAVNGLKQLWAIVGPYLIPSFKALTNTLQTNLVPTLKRLYDFIQPYIIPTLKILAIIIGGTLVAAIWLIINVLNAFIKVWTWVQNVLIEVYERVVWFVNGVVAYVTFMYNVWAAIFNAMKAIVTVIFQAIAIVIATYVSMIMAVVQPIANALYTPFNNAKNWIVGAWNGLIGWFWGVGGAIGNALGNVYHYMTSPFSRAWDFVSQIPGRIVNSIGNIGSLLRQRIGDWDIPGPLGRVRDVIPGFANGVRNFGGGLAVVGERGPELVSLPRGSNVYTNGESKGMVGGGSTNNFTGDIYLGDQGAVREFFGQLDRNNQLAQRGLTTIKGY